MQIIHNELYMFKVSILLGLDLKRTRLNMSREILVIFSSDLVTMDETWIHNFQPETKHQWKHIGSPPTKEAKTGISAGKVMSSMF